MSSYLLLRNNKESGPFTLEEIKSMSLKSYDLLWVVGKSAAWRYPGEIAELKSFAPPVPGQISDGPVKQRMDNFSADSSTSKKTDSSNAKTRENNSQRNASRSVYVHLPAEQKSIVIPPDRNANDTNSSAMSGGEPAYDFSDLYKTRPTRAIRFSGKVLWIGTIILLFGTGILTGFFISDRRKFFSTDANHPQNQPAVQPAAANNKKEISPAEIQISRKNVTDENILKNTVPDKPVSAASGKLTGSSVKNISKNNGIKKDSAVKPADSFSPPLKTADSVRQVSISNAQILYQKIKAHPENYLGMVTGRYSTGLFGGISSFPVTMTNNSPVQFDLVAISIDYIQNNEKVFKTETLSFNDLEPGETVTLRAPKSPRGVKIATRIRMINSRQLDLSYSN